VGGGVGGGVVGVVCSWWVWAGVYLSQWGGWGLVSGGDISLYSDNKTAQRMQGVSKVTLNFLGFARGKGHPRELKKLSYGVKPTNSLSYKGQNRKMPVQTKRSNPDLKTQRRRKPTQPVQLCWVGGTNRQE